MSGRSWTTREEEELFNELASEISIEQIAVNHKRTYGAIRARQRHLAAQLFQGGNMRIEEIMEKCRMTKKQVMDTLERRGLLESPTKDVETQTDGQHICTLCGHLQVCKGS
jgi:hypothetical protein